jgi:hypothetical protein
MYAETYVTPTKQIHGPEEHVQVHKWSACTLFPLQAGSKLGYSIHTPICL